MKNLHLISSGASIYTLPGLGFDERIFSKIDFGKSRVRHLNWIAPGHMEGFTDYAKRIATSIDNKDERVVLIGHSFGGVMAQEIAQYIDVQKIILLSSIKSREEMPWYFRVVSPLGLHRLFTGKLISGTFAWWARSHGYRSSEEQSLFTNMIKRQSDSYLHWALKSLSEWDPSSVPGAKIAHIHGEKDKTFPIHLLTTPYRTVGDGSHFMVYSQAEIVGKMIREEIEVITA